MQERVTLTADSTDCCAADGHHHHHHHRVPLPPAARLSLDGTLLSARGVMVVRQGRTLLDHIDIDVEHGEIVTLIGPNGAGKTTLVRVLLGLEPQDAGTVSQTPGLRIGYVPQRFDVERAIPLNVLRFLTLGQRAAESDAMNALSQVGAGAIARQQIARLSGGELQRVLLARALLRDPHLLVLDEPVRGVDYVGEAELYTLIGKLRTERRFGVLLVSHDLHVVMAQSDRVICLNRHVCCSGVPHTVARHPEYVRLFGKEMAGAFGVYEHHHDHVHDIAGAPTAPLSAPTSSLSLSPTPNPSPQGGGEHKAHKAAAPGRR